MLSAPVCRPVQSWHEELKLGGFKGELTTVVNSMLSEITNFGRL